MTYVRIFFQVCMRAHKQSALTPFCPLSTDVRKKEYFSIFVKKYLFTFACSQLVVMRDGAPVFMQKVNYEPQCVSIHPGLTEVAVGGLDVSGVLPLVSKFLTVKFIILKFLKLVCIFDDPDKK